MFGPFPKYGREKFWKQTNSHVYWPTRLAQVVLAADSAGTSVHDALIDRAVPAALNLIPRTRLASQPNYISDIGLRPLSDPWKLLQLHSFDLNLPDRAQRVSEVITGWDSGSMSDASAMALLDAVVCFAGEWEDARLIGLEIAHNDRSIQDSRLAGYVAAVLAATTVPGSCDDDLTTTRDLFGLAASPAPTVGDMAMIQLRVATWHAKRCGQVNETIDTLARIRADIHRAQAHGEMSEADRDIIVALTMNLEALLAVRTGDLDQALTLMRSAADLCSSTHWVSIDRDAGYRYQTQIRTNLAQVLWKLDLRTGAHQTLEANLNLTSTVHTSSRSEAVSIAAYYLYLDGRFEAGRRHVTEAIRLIAREGAPSRLSKTRKIAAAICDGMGDHEMTNVYLAAITADPMGLAEFSHGA
jgi:hypothetical protein